MPSITLHNIDNKLYSLLKTQSEKNGLSLNKTIKQLLKEHFGLAKTQENEFDDFLGIWSKADEQEFLNKTQDFNIIDEDDWK